MKLSEAIRLGATMAPQGFGQFKDSNGRTCALGAAREAAGSLDDFDWLLNSTVSTPKCIPTPHSIESPVGTIITHFNDIMFFSRNEIADWVETVEKEIEAEQLKEAQNSIRVVDPLIETEELVTA